MEQNFITVIGAGAWGTAVADLLARNGHWVCLYSHEKEVVHDINQTHFNERYLPEVQLLPSVWATNNPERAAEAEMIFVALPVPRLREGLAPFAPFMNREKTCVILSKGIEAETGTLPLPMIGETLGQIEFAIVSGPNFAHELIQPYPMGTVVTSFKHQVASSVAHVLKNKHLSVTLSDDMVGVQLCGALKNVLSIGIGIARGVHAPENTIAYLFSRGLDEIATIVRARGGKRSTVYGLAGVGDAALSSLGSSGRNRKLGELIGEGVALNHALQFFRSPPEGVATLQALALLEQQLNLNLPFLRRVREVVSAEKAPHTLLSYDVS